MDDNAKVRLMLGYLCVANEAEASLPRKVQVLDRFDLADAEIAAICGCSAQSVRNARLQTKKKPHAHKTKA